MQKQAATARRDIQGRQLDIAEEELGLKKIGVASDILKTLSIDERTAAVKNYEFHVEQAKAAGETPKSFAKWQREERTGNQKDYDRYVFEGGDLNFHEWLLALKKAGATRIGLGELTERKKALGAVGEVQDITSFKFRENIDKEIAKDLEDDFNYIAAPPGAKSAIKRERTMNKIEERLKSSGEVVSVEAEKKPNGELGWNVTLKDGEVKWVRFE